MRYNKNFIINFYFLTTVALSCGAEHNKKNDFYEIEEIKAVDYLRRIEYISPNTVAITGSCGLYILNLHEKDLECISKKNFCAKYIYEPILRINNEKVISCIDEQVMIYDTKTYKKKILNHKSVDLAIHPREKTIFLLHENRKVITTFNCISGITECIPTDETKCLCIDIHPKKEIMCRIYNANISFYPLNDLKKIIKTINFSEHDSTFCRYNTDGSFLAMGNKSSIYVINPDQETNDYQPIKQATQFEFFKKISFHPNGWLAILLRIEAPKEKAGNVIYYWDLKKKEFVYTMSALGEWYCKDFSFSQNGLDVVVALYNKCIRTRVPFAVDNAIKVLWRLNQLKAQEKISQDIVKYCFNLSLSRSSF